MKNTLYKNIDGILLLYIEKVKTDLNLLKI